MDGRAKKRTKHGWQDGIEGKICSKCKTWHPLTDYNKCRTFWDGLQRTCVHCIAARYLAKGKKHQRARLLKRHGMTIEDYNKRFTDQNGCCAICGRHQIELNKTLAVDHDHVTGKVRGLLCQDCNLILGYAKDNVGVLANGISYLER